MFTIESSKNEFGGNVYCLLFHDPHPTQEDIRKAAYQIDDRAAYLGFRLLAKVGPFATIKIHST